MQITMPYSGRLAGKSESFELLRSEDNALMFCNIRPKQPFNKPVHKTFGDEKKNSTCLSFRKHSLSNRALCTLAALGVLIRKAIATTKGIRLRTITVGKPDAPFHIARLQHSAVVHGSDGGTECRGDYIEQPYQLHFVHPHVGGIGRHGNSAAPVHRDCCPFHRLCVIGRNVRLSCSQRRICRFQV